MSDRIKIQQIETLADDWGKLKKTTFEYRRGDGTWQTLTRETYDRGNGSTILLYNPARRTVVLTRQFRYPVYVNGHSGMLIETCAGLLDERDPETAIKHETEEETGYKLTSVRKVFEAYMSPGSVTEKLYFFVAEYDAPVGKGGGLEADGEDISVVELDFDRALRMVRDGEIVDGKTIMLLQHAQINKLLG